MPRTLDDRDWDILLNRIREGKCTPFLGAGAAYGALPLGADIARKWAGEFKYPMDDPENLTRVAQYVAIEYDPMYPKEEVVRLLRDARPPDFSEPDEPHAILASLPLPIYLTTNYDDFLVQALRANGKKPVQEYCRWNTMVRSLGVEPPPASLEPSAENPLVYHLHGHLDVAESLVLTQDDYLDFLVEVSRNDRLLHHRIQRALAGTSLLFVGYALEDWSFRVLFRGLVNTTEASLRRVSVTVQLPVDSGPNQQALEAYLDKYFEKLDMKVYRGTAREFVAELKQRWTELEHGE